MVVIIHGQQECRVEVRIFCCAKLLHRLSPFKPSCVDGEVTAASASWPLSIGHVSNYFHDLSSTRHQRSRTFYRNLRSPVFVFMYPVKLNKTTPEGRKLSTRETIEWSRIAEMPWLGRPTEWPSFILWRYVVAAHKYQHWLVYSTATLPKNTIYKTTQKSVIAKTFHIFCSKSYDSTFFLYCGRVPAANAPGCTAAEGLLYKPWSLVVPTCTARCLHQRP